MPLSTSFQLLDGPESGRQSCQCSKAPEATRFIAITGGPGAGKTALLNLAKNIFCKHVAFIPESATLLFSGGFWRRSTSAGLRGAQRAIFHTQRQLEEIVLADCIAPFALCDRGTVDGFAYWPASEVGYWEAMGTTRQNELDRYFAVIHLRTPSLEMGYDLSNPARNESIQAAQDIDHLIFSAWKGHPLQFVIEANGDFQAKAAEAMMILKDLIKI